MEKLLGTERINKLIIKLSLPAITAMVISGLYNVIDTIFISVGVGDNGIAATAIAFPIQMIMLGICFMIGVGTASIVSKKLGEGDIKGVNIVANSAIGLQLVLAITIGVIGMLFTKRIAIIFGAKKEMIQFSIQYIFWIMGFCFIEFSNVLTSFLLRCQGKVKHSMISMLIGALTNVLLDPFFIFDNFTVLGINLKGFNLGIKGAAIATIIAQLMALTYNIIQFKFFKGSIELSIRKIKIKLSIYRDIIYIGMASFARNSINAIIALTINHSIYKLGGPMGVSTYGIINRLFMFTFMPIYGILQGIQPILGYNYGMQNRDRVVKTMKLGIKYSFIYGAMVLIILVMYKENIINLFTKSDQLLEMSFSSVGVVFSTFPLIAMQIIAASIFTVMGRGMTALILAVGAQLFVFIPGIYIMVNIMNVEFKHFWYIFPISQIFACLLTFYFVNKEYRKRR